jgi:hypothetical protein
MNDDTRKATPPSSKRLNDPDYWLSRAEEARAIAGQMKHSDTRASMLRVAQQYEELAQKAERRQLTKELKTSP